MSALPTYMRIRQYVIDLVIEHAAKDFPIMSERELCRKFSVTRPTARRALKELIDEGYLCAKPGLGTFINPSKGINSHYAFYKSFKVMAIFGSGRHTDLDGFSMNILARICDHLKHLPIRLRMATLNLTERSMALEELEMYNLDGIIWIRPDKFSMDLISKIKQRIPVYTVGNVVSGVKSHITMDYYQCGRMLAAWFLERKRNRVVFTGFSEELPIKATVYSGWRDEFKSRGIPYDKNLSINMNCDIIASIKKLLSSSSIDGIFTFASEFAAVEKALSENGQIAGACPIVLDENHFGFNNIVKPAARLIMFPSEIIEETARHLFKSLNDPTHQPDEIVLAPKIEDL